MKLAAIVSPDGIKFKDNWKSFSEIYTIEGWYVLIDDYDNMIGESYLRNGVRLGWFTQNRNYYFLPSDKILSSKEEFHRYLNLIAFI